MGKFCVMKGEHIMKGSFPFIMGEHDLIQVIQINRLFKSAQLLFPGLSVRFSFPSCSPSAIGIIAIWTVVCYNSRALRGAGFSQVG